MFEKQIAKPPVIVALALGVLSSGCALKSPAAGPVGLTAAQTSVSAAKAPGAKATPKYAVQSKDATVTATTRNSKNSKITKNSKNSKMSNKGKGKDNTVTSKKSVRSATTQKKVW
jgi:hypothetical protein